MRSDWIGRACGRMGSHAVISADVAQRLTVETIVDMQRESVAVLRIERGIGDVRQHGVRAVGGPVD